MFVFAGKLWYLQSCFHWSVSSLTARTRPLTICSSSLCAALFLGWLHHVIKLRLLSKIIQRINILQRLLLRWSTRKSHQISGTPCFKMVPETFCCVDCKGHCFDEFFSGDEGFEATRSVADWHRWTRTTLLDAVYGTKALPPLLMKVKPGLNCYVCICLCTLHIISDCVCVCVSCFFVCLLLLFFFFVYSILIKCKTIDSICSVWRYNWLPPLVCETNQVWFVCLFVCFFFFNETKSVC
jgi:hypothetical protein